MEVEIKKTENGWHCKDKDNGEEDWCFETAKSMLDYLKDYLPKNIGDEVKLSD